MRLASAPTENAWTSRRRLLTALAGGTPDRVPVNTYELAGRNSLDWCNQQPSYRGLMDYIRAHTRLHDQLEPAAGHGPLHLRGAVSCAPTTRWRLRPRTETAGQFQRTTRVCHTPKGDLRSVDTEDRGRPHHLAGRALVQEHSRRGQSPERAL